MSEQSEAIRALTKFTHHELSLCEDPDLRGAILTYLYTQPVTVAVMAIELAMRDDPDNVYVLVPFIAKYMEKGDDDE